MNIPKWLSTVKMVEFERKIYLVVIRFRLRGNIDFWYCNNMKPKITDEIAVTNVSKNANTQQVNLVLKQIKRVGIIFKDFIAAERLK